MPDSDSPASGVPMDVTQSLGSQSPGQITGGQIPPGNATTRTNTDGEGFPHNGSKQSMVKYGELIILGYNGQLPQGNFLINLEACTDIFHIISILTLSL